MKCKWLLGGIRWSAIGGSAIGLAVVGTVVETVLPNSLQVAPVHAQAVVSDGTVNTLVTRSGNRFTIDNGTPSGNNLFHSFQEFSLPTGGSVIFNNAPTVQNIFSRVTGGTVSTIDGIIQANGSANLFLLNPAGILFGPNAALNIGGSFVGTTAQSIQFADGAVFSAGNPSNPPLLTMSAPIGVQLGSDPGAIQVQGNGHTLTAKNPISAPIIGGPSSSGLQVQSGKTLALVGGSLVFTGGILTAPQGQIELGSVRDTQVNLVPSASGFTFTYPTNAKFQDIQLSQRSLINVSGASAGAVQVQGQHIRFDGGSFIWSQNRGPQAAGTIRIQASEALQLQGTTPNLQIRSGLVAETLSAGSSSNLFIATPQLGIEGGAVLVSRTFSSAAAGNVQVQARELIQVSGVSLLDARVFSTLGSLTFGHGNSGNVTLSSQKVAVLDGANVAVATFGRGTGGNLMVNADTVEVIGMTTGVPSFLASALSASSNGPGAAGSILINTRTLAVKAGGLLSVVGRGTGNAGSIVVNASESIHVNGQGANAPNPTEIRSAITDDKAIKQFLGLPLNLLSQGESGSVILNTPSLRITDGATVTVRNEGNGKAGSLEVNAGEIWLNHQGNLIATTLTGKGGDIVLKTHTLVLRQGSVIAATAGGGGDGGNVTIQAPIMVGLDNSDIIANAFKGRGGNITIATQGIIGLEFRDTLVPRTDLTNDITASSQFNVNGTVQINNIGVDPNAGLVELPATLTDASQTIAAGCPTNASSRFVITGRGGVPVNPMQRMPSPIHPWVDLRSPSPSGTIAQTPTPTPAIVQATAWYRNPQTGTVELVAANSSPSAIPASCALASR
ncbi:S-layer family protein [Alkalinema sp. FACHB-956]|uniref:beta strand repeat-containing protein n=1 Tax=Alkalinema sp. FACHB-956 TaxID=2692768 RepID=UPI00168688F8|nr:S-layer family protein [Alkalinema sp. FACHB-956]MBD2325849.1 S-layer family protein [Alkalinema sp. FACHB-956]